MIAVSFFTNNGSYPALAERLHNSCDAVGLRHKIVSVKDRPTWHNAVNLKPGFILHMLMEAREPVLWLDCDCEVRKFPSLLADTDADLAVYEWRHGERDWDGSEICNSGGASYWAYTAPAMELLVRWGHASQQYPDMVDDQTLDAVWKASRPTVKPLWLPKTYNWMESHFGPTPEDCVIWHDYAEGRHREAVDAGRLATVK